MVYPISKLWLYPLCKILIKRIEGVENIPDKTPFIVVANHETRCDHLLIIYPILKKLNKVVYFLAVPRWWYSIKFLRQGLVEIIPIVNTKKAYKQAKSVLESNGIISIFPEGRLERKNRKIKPKTGAVRLALKTKVPILPIGINFSYIPFNSTINIGRLIHIKKKSQIKKQMINLMNYVYRLRDGLD